MIAILLEASIRVALIAALVALTVFVLKIRSSALRHAIWTLTMLVMLVSPALVIWKPALPESAPRVPHLDLPFAPPDLSTETRTEPVAANVSTRAAATAAPPEASPATVGARVASSAPSTRVPWSFAALAIRLAGVVGFTLHLAIGWRMARGLSQSTVPISPAELPCPVRVEVTESGRVSVPVLVGTFRPFLALPIEWRSWSSDVLLAALMHEDAHARRRDGATALVARINRCVFWFHPVAWWLESAMRRTAEEACDDVVVRGTREGRSYAEALLGMATTLRTRGQRVAWNMAGMAGGDRLESRIDRALNGDAFLPLSPWRVAAVLALSGVVMATGVACQQQPAPLQPNSEYAARRVAERERSQHLEGLQTMTKAEVEALEVKVAADPDDLKSTERLLGFYVQSGHKVLGWNEMIARRRRVLVGLVERHPESQVAFQTVVERHDPEGFAALKTLWLKHVDRPDATPAVLDNAAAFFRASDKPQAETLWKRALSLDPDGAQPRMTATTFHPGWTWHLGSLYAQGIVGANDSTIGNVVQTVSVEEARGRFAETARRTLEVTRDAQLLTTAGGYLMNNVRLKAGTLHFDPHALGRSYVERALEIEPDLTTARRALLRDDGRRRHERVWTIANDVLRNPKALPTLSEQERFELGPEIATSLIGLASSSMTTSEQRAVRTTARTLAETALALSERYRADDDFGDVVYEGNIVLGGLAYRDGSRRRAIDHLKAAVASPGSPRLRVGIVFPPAYTVDLLKDGEREAVIEYLEGLARLDTSGRDRWLEDVQFIRAGEAPSFHANRF